jgi:signal peptidase I
VPGAGHILLGRFRRGIAWAAGIAGAGVAILLAMLVTPMAAVAAVVAGLVGPVACAVDAMRRPGDRPRWRLVLLGWAALVAGGVLLLLVKYHYREHYRQAFTILSGAMRDTLLVGDYILVDKAPHRRLAPRRGDIVVFRYPPDERRTFIFRIVATPGETLHLRDRRVLIDGRPLDEPYVRGGLRWADAEGGPCRYAYGCEPLRLPADAYFVMGDNRDNAQDSRYWGIVRRGQILGTVWAVYWSWDMDRHWLRSGRLGLRISWASRPSAGPGPRWEERAGVVS